MATIAQICYRFANSRWHFFAVAASGPNSADRGSETVIDVNSVKISAEPDWERVLAPNRLMKLDYRVRLLQC